MANIVNLFLDSTEFSASTAVYTDIDLTTKAPDGYYTYGTLNRRQLSGVLQVGLECSTIDPCSEPVDCVVSAWSEWSVCSGSKQSRTRTIITPASGGGTPCPILEETQACVEPILCVNLVETVISPTPQTGINNYFGVNVSLNPWPVSENVTVSGYIVDDDDINNRYVFSILINSPNQSGETEVGVLQTGPSSTATIYITGATPTDVTFDGQSYNICGFEKSQYKGALYDFSGISNPQTYSIQEFGPFSGYERITLLNGDTINEYNWASTIDCSNIPVSVVTITETSKTFAKYVIFNDVTVQVVGEFWMDATTPTDRATWQSSGTKKYSPFSVC